MIDDNLLVTREVLARVTPGERVGGSSGPVPGGVLDVRGRILNVRKGRSRGRRCSPLPYTGVNRRRFGNLRRSSRYADRVNDRVVTVLVPAGEALDRLVGREIKLKLVK